MLSVPKGFGRPGPLHADARSSAPSENEMSRLTHRTKHIACLEGLWHKNLLRPYSVRHVLRSAADLGDFRHIHLTCNTIAEFEYNLGLLRARRGFGILYLAFHGSPGHVELPSGELDLEQLGQMMRQGFRRWIIHFGTCSTIDVPQERLDSFLSVTGAAMVMGYQRDVDWVESASLDFLLFQAVQEYVDARHLWNKVAGRYPDLVHLTGLTARWR